LVIHARSRRYGGDVDADTAAVDIDDPAADESAPGNRRRAVVISVAAVLATAVVVGGLAWAWHWRTHPDAFPGAGDQVGMTLDRSRPTMYVGITGQDTMEDGPITIDAAAPHLVENSARAGFAFYLCDVQENTGGIGVAYPRGFDRDCADPVPVVGETRFGQDQYLVMQVTVHRAGLVRTRGVELTYTDGWQHGTQTIGTSLRVVSR
jgi:hypothetical protein